MTGEDRFIVRVAKFKEGRDSAKESTSGETLRMPSSIGTSCGPDAPRTSQILQAFVTDLKDERVRLGGLVDSLGDKAYGLLLILFAAPNLLPFGVPGISSILALPMIILALQFTAGRARPWLPCWLAKRTMSAASIRRLIAFIVPWLQRAERLVRPRLTRLAAGPAQRVLGAAILVLALVLALPIPLGNWLPAAAIIILSLAAVARDGIAAIVGVVAGIASLVVVAMVIDVALLLIAQALAWIWP